jgi:succinate dehydrogenase/fumarate reductase-like Fe-S protein
MPFENQLELNIRAFFFNAKTDYLPYYKNFSFTLDKKINLKEVLKLIKDRNRDFSYPDKDLIFKVNGLMVTGDEDLSTVVDRLGTQLTIEPALTYHSDNGLIINNRDFMQQYKRILGQYSTKENLAYYMTLYPLHYASETFNYNHEYIGDAILVLASKMIAEGNEYKYDILEAINDEFNGISCCEYENNLFSTEDYSSTISELKKMVRRTNKKSIMDRISELTLCKKKSFDIESTDGHAVAVYAGDDLSHKLLEKTKLSIQNSGAKFVPFNMSTKLAGQTLLKSNHQMAYLKAGTMLLEALDSGADILVCLKDEDVSIFKSILAKAERVMGRDIDIMLISLVELQKLTIKVKA